MGLRRCERSWEVDAVREGRLSAADTASAERHRAACDACRALFADDEALARLARELPARAVNDVEARRGRARLLGEASAPQAPSRRPAVVVAATLAVATAMAALVARRPPLATARASSAPPPRAVVMPSEGTELSLARFGPIEIIALGRGAIHVRVRHQSDDERFLVALPDGELEVRGTELDVAADDARTLSVRVQEGLVALRVAGAAEVLLRAGEQWPAPLTIAPIAVASAAPAAPPPDAFGAAMALYRARRFEEAANAFHLYAAAHPSQGEDAAFLEAASLAYAGRGDAAAIVAERFLARYPRSFRARDAAVLVARAARDRGACDDARRVLAPWARDAAPDVTGALGACAAFGE